MLEGSGRYTVLSSSAHGSYCCFIWLWLLFPKIWMMIIIPSDGLSRQQDPLDFHRSGLLEGLACEPHLCLCLGRAKPSHRGDNKRMVGGTQKQQTRPFSVGSSAGCGVGSRRGAAGPCPGRRRGRAGWGGAGSGRGGARGGGGGAELRRLPVSGTAGDGAESPPDSRSGAGAVGRRRDHLYRGAEWTWWFINYFPRSRAGQNFQQICERVFFVHAGAPSRVSAPCRGAESGVTLGPLGGCPPAAHPGAQPRLTSALQLRNTCASLCVDT